MTGIFANIPTENTEKFFMSLAMSDGSMPHTKTKLSPITFSEFLNRNGVIILAPYNEYEEANKIWCKFYSVSSGLFQASHRCHYDLDQAEVKHPGWDMMIDYLNRMLEVEKMSESPYYQMHYVAHVAYNFTHEVDQFEDVSKQTAYKIIFNDLINPILYEPLVPVKYSFLPIENYADIRFTSDIAAMVGKIKQYIATHTGANLDYVKFDEHRTRQIIDDLKATMTAVYNNKFKSSEEFHDPVKRFLCRCAIYKCDMELCELFDMFRVNGMECVALMDKIMRFKKRFEKGLFEDDYEDLIDNMLDLLPVPKKGEQNAQAQSDGDKGNDPKSPRLQDDAH